MPAPISACLLFEEVLISGAKHQNYSNHWPQLLFALLWSCSVCFLLAAAINQSTHTHPPAQLQKPQVMRPQVCKFDRSANLSARGDSTGRGTVKGRPWRWMSDFLRHRPWLWLLLASCSHGHISVALDASTAAVGDPRQRSACGRKP